jgi:hypothetical protein
MECGRRGVGAALPPVRIMASSAQQQRLDTPREEMWTWGKERCDEKRREVRCAKRGVRRHGGK